VRQGIYNMNAAKMTELADNIVHLADRLRDDVSNERERRPLFDDIFTLRRSLGTLEHELLDPEPDNLGDAC
jgi:hypothetical protein